MCVALVHEGMGTWVKWPERFCSLQQFCWNDWKCVRGSAALGILYCCFRTFSVYSRKCFRSLFFYFFDKVFAETPKNFIFIIFIILRPLYLHLYECVSVLVWFILCVYMCGFANICKWINLLLSVVGLPVQISPVNSFINVKPKPGISSAF